MIQELKISNSQRQFWERHSYLILRSFFTKEIEQVSKWIDEVSRWPEDISRHLNFFEMNDNLKLSRIENFVPYHEGLADVLLNDNLLHLVSELMGESAILYKDRINFKPPGGGAHSAHQDGVAYESGNLGSFKSDVVPYISILICVDPASTENGCFEVLQYWPIDDLTILPMERPDPKHPNFSKICQDVEDRLTWVPIETNPGDLILFTERLPHRSAINNSSDERRILYGVYNPESEGDKREQYFDEKRRNINDARYMVGNPHAPSQV